VPRAKDGVVQIYGRGPSPQSPGDLREQLDELSQPLVNGADSLSGGDISRGALSLVGSLPHGRIILRKRLLRITIQLA
jgi:hypothetical protein